MTSPTPVTNVFKAVEPATTQGWSSTDFMTYIKTVSDDSGASIFSRNRLSVK